MIGVPYLSIFGVGYLIYRGVKKNEAYRLTQSQHDEPAA
jgi:hypothetical protein